MRWLNDPPIKLTRRWLRLTHRRSPGAKVGSSGSLVPGSIKLVAFDVDGVLTDGRIHYLSSGTEMLSFHVHDGAAIKRLLQHGIEVALITGRASPMVAKRARELGIHHIFQNVEDKLETLQSLAAELRLGALECAYVGDDWPDLEVLGWVGLPVAAADAQPEARAAAEFVTASAGGRGVAAEVCRLLLDLREP